MAPRNMINPLNREALREKYRDAQPFPHLVIENFLRPDIAEEIASSYPSFERAQELGFGFNFVNEQRKIQVTDPAKFPDPVQRLNDALASRAFLDDVEFITGIPRLLADERLEGGGMHLTGAGGRLDVHVDFNLLESRKLFRRLNILVYLNPTWRDEWGGQIELWDRDVRTCHLRSVPLLNRCLIFETSDISYHGVAPVKAPTDVVRKSFAAYYYTKEAPPRWDGTSHSTLFKARPNERLRRFVQMPLERFRRQVVDRLYESKRWVKSRIGLS
jgi:Rps23 Pro-64 3,4-dihydroxylase Tpa1-like proline 4-hydroxylase